MTVAGTSGEVTVTGSPLTFSPTNWDTAKTVMVNAGADADATNDNASLTHNSASTDTDYGSSLDIDGVSVTVTDTTPILQLLTDPAAVNEGESISLTVTSDKDLTGDVTVSLTMAARSSSSFDADDIAATTLGPNDFTASFGVSASRTGTVSIPTSTDSLTEGAENYTITLNAGTGYVVGTDETANGTLNDVVAPGVSIDPTSLTVEEGSTGKYTVALDTAPSASVTVTVAGTSGEVTVTGSPVIFAPANWDTAKTVTVSAGADADATNDSATLTHKASGSATGYSSALSIDEVSVTVTDTTPTLQLLTNPAAVSEGENISLTVTSDMDLTGDVTVKLILAARSSSSFDADDITGTLGPRDFPASFGSTGSKTGTVSIPTSRDAATEGAENYTITLNDGSDYVVGTSKTADSTLNDGTISLSIGDVSAVEDGTFSFTVAASPTPSAPVTFKYKVTKESGDTATAGTDFTEVSTATTKTIAANAASTTITVTVTDNDLDEDNETFTVTLSEPSVGVRLADATATGTITDDDNSPVLADIEDETIKLGQAVDITATATDGDSDTISYTWTRKTGETIPAVPGSPALNQARLTFTPAATGTYTMTVTADDGNSDSEEVVITVTTASVVSVPSTLMFTEGTDSQARVTITTTDAFGENVSFNVSYQDSTATGAATLSAGDYKGPYIQ